MERNCIKKRIRMFLTGANRGSATVEAAVLIPLILSVYMMLIFFSVYLYGRSAAVSVTCRACVLAAKMEHESGNAVTKEMNVFLNDCAGRIPLTAGVSASSQAGLLSAGAQMSFSGIFKSFFLPMRGTELSFSDRRKIQRLDPAKVIWGIRIANGSGQQKNEGE